MNILYVTSCWTPLLDVLYNGAESLNGMPAFGLALKKLIEEGHSVDIIFYDNYPENKNRPLNIQLPWLKKARILTMIHTAHKDGLLKPFFDFQLYAEIRRCVKDACNNNAYDIIYGHGSHSEAANSTARKKGIPFGVRRYGDSYLRLIRLKGYFYSILSEPINFLCYKRKKAFVIATNDGSQVDKTVKRINKEKKPYDFYFWLNGTPSVPASFDPPALIPDSPYLLYVARFSEWKCPHLAVEMLNNLKKRGQTPLLLYAGQKDSPEVFDQVFSLAEKYGLSDQVKYLGTLTRSEIIQYSQHAAACLSFYSLCNLGNVFIEYLASGGAIISLDDGSLDDIIQNGENGFLVNSMEEAAEIAHRLLTDPQEWQRVKDRALETASSKFQTWDKRIDDEIRLLSRYAGQK